MKKLLLSLVLAVLPLGLSAASGTAIPGGNQSVTFVINKPGAYYLAADRLMTNQTLPAIQILVPDVTLDLNGYAVRFADISGTGDAIEIKASNVEVRNGSILNTPGYAIDGAVAKLTGLRVIDVRASDTQGINVGGDGTIVDRCQVTDTRGTGIRISGIGSQVYRSVVRNVDELNGSGGVGVFLGYATTIADCTITNTAGPGIYCYPRCTVVDNRIEQANLSQAPKDAGITLVTAGSSHLRGNTVLFCYAAGIRVGENSSGCVIENNVISNTRQAGPQLGTALVTSAASTLLRGNLGVDNDGSFISGIIIDAGGNHGY